MKLAVLGSGSRGNAFAVTANGCSLLLDAGFGARTVVRRAKKAGVDLRALVGIVLTHEHGDHARGAAPLARKLGCPIYASSGTLTALGDRLGGAIRKRITAHEPLTVGPFTVTGCRTSHDAAEPMAFVVAANGARLGLAYDLGRPTAAVRYLLRGVTTLLLEPDSIHIALGDEWMVYAVRVQGNKMTLSGGDLEEPMNLERVGPATPRQEGVEVPPAPPASRRAIITYEPFDAVTLSEL